MTLNEYLTVRNGWHTTGKNKGKLRTWLTIREGILLGFDTEARSWKKSEHTFSIILAEEALKIAVSMGRSPSWHRLNKELK